MKMKRLALFGLQLVGQKGGDKAYSFCQTFTTAVATATTGLPNFVSQYLHPHWNCQLDIHVIIISYLRLVFGFFFFFVVYHCLFQSLYLVVPCVDLHTSTQANNDPFGTVVTGTTVGDKSITLPGFAPGMVTLTVAAYDNFGKAILQTFSLLFGSITMPVLVVDELGAPVIGITVTASATVFPGIEQSGTTDSTGVLKLTNLAPTTIGLFTQNADNKIGINGVAATSGTVTVKLIPFLAASNTTDFNTSDGLSGWTGGTVKDVAVVKRDTILAVATNGRPDLQTAHAEPKVYPFSKSVYIKYKFQTAEVPGGYFGTQYNDYFLVSIRSNTGGSTAISRSMNELGLGAFDSSGATDWFTLTLDLPLAPAPKTDWVEFNVGVSNVADSLLDSQIIVDKIGDLTCDQCGSCETCPGDPMCQPTCKTPPEKSCAFYSDCAEAALRCGPTGYPLAYGRKNCLAFQGDLLKFTAAGQTFIWATMHCLQVKLRDAIVCDSKCPAVFDAAFASHPACYVDSGFCDLPPEDWWQLIKTVNTDLVSRKSLEQMIQTSQACAGKMLDKIDAAVQGYLDKALTDVANAVLYLAKAAAMKVLKKLVDDLLHPGPVI
ncbi:hypothetical protein B0H63DRAFT_454787 [Podospora didyma]|uniref:Uncharacterized protein n=1 Tax=Podospora didyma TaxID=330526 RepID=A0AAE0N4N1_9PEZI|nr:hypothetical protein B0H63DRAFT_454787 [Podospora didyma]